MAHSWLFTSNSEHAEQIHLGTVIKGDPTVDYCVWSFGYDMDSDVHVLRGFVHFKDAMEYADIVKTKLFQGFHGDLVAWDKCSVQEAEFYDTLKFSMDTGVYPSDFLMEAAAERECDDGPEVVDLTGPDLHSTEVLAPQCSPTGWDDSSCDGRYPLHRHDAEGDLAAMAAADLSYPPDLSCFY